MGRALRSKNTPIRLKANSPVKEIISVNSGIPKWVAPVYGRTPPPATPLAQFIHTDSTYWILMFCEAVMEPNMVAALELEYTGVESLP
ncbi:hypothetical protein EVAR_56288_1 [Eumeta japonica]|uniref:Uncharacterized protein n=1 Tax=Eumeta variegata TaxID=151549 RepID=A0A4C1YKP4_EUMVA|nr:hypothetical protein EVAR_56288_1 [Eumeta japonica]